MSIKSSKASRMWLFRDELPKSVNNLRIFLGYEPLPLERFMDGETDYTFSELEIPKRKWVVGINNDIMLILIDPSERPTKISYPNDRENPLNVVTILVKERSYHPKKLDRLESIEEPSSYKLKKRSNKPAVWKLWQRFKK